MRHAGKTTLFELRDMIGMPGIQTGLRDGSYARAVPEPFSDGLLARLRGAWEVICGRAYPTVWPKPGDLEKALNPHPPQILGRRPKIDFSQSKNWSGF